MSRFFLGFLAVFALIAFSVTDAQAQKEKKEEAELSPAEQAKKDALTEKVSEILKSLDLAQMQHFTVIYANYMVLSMVNTVQKDVDKAVQGCNENNKAMEPEMNTRFDSWKAALEQPRKDSLANIDNMIAAQNYLPKAEFEAIFALVDETRIKTSNEINKVPVTTPEACRYMITKMDETQKQMVELLSSTLVTYPDMLKQTQQ